MKAQPRTLRIAVLDDYQRIARECADWSLLAAHEVTFFHEPLADSAATLRSFDVIALMRERTAFPASLIAQLPNLRLLVTTGQGNAAIDVAAASARGVTVCGTQSLPHPTAELTWGLILALARRIPQEENSLRSGGWQSTVGFSLKGRTIGILGLGRLGSQVASFGVAFGMRVIAWSQNLTTDRAEECHAKLVRRDELFRESDVLTIHLVLSERTRGLVGEAELAQMKPTALLVNTSRAPIVDEAAVVEALTSGVIAGAALDVYSAEPIDQGNPLLRAPNTILTPHVGYVTDDNYAMFYAQTVEDILAYVAGEPIRVISAAQ